MKRPGPKDLEIGHVLRLLDIFPPFTQMMLPLGLFEGCLLTPQMPAKPRLAHQVTGGRVTAIREASLGDPKHLTLRETSRLQSRAKVQCPGAFSGATHGGACSEFQATPLQMEAELAEKLAFGEADVNPMVAASVGSEQVSGCRHAGIICSARSNNKNTVHTAAWKENCRL